MMEYAVIGILLLGHLIRWQQVRSLRTRLKQLERYAEMEEAGHE